MSDAGATAATAAATGVLSIPVLAAMGIDPPAMIAGLIGCVIVQTLLPTHGRTLRSVILITLGSVLFASLMTAVVEPWAARKALEVLELQLQPEPRRAVTAGFLGAFAQPLMLLAQTVVGKISARLVVKAEKGGSDA